MVLCSVLINNIAKKELKGLVQQPGMSTFKKIYSRREKCPDIPDSCIETQWPGMCI